MKVRLLLVIVLSMFLFACVGSPIHMALLSENSLKNQSEVRLCNAYANIRSKKIRTEIENRNIITDNEWSLIENKKIQMGMSEWALIASWGKPGLFGDIYSTKTIYGEHKQYIYRPCELCITTIVYVDNGSVIGWSEY